MPTSYTMFKQEVKQWFLDNIPSDRIILDAGPGMGIYADLLKSLNYQMDAVEIWHPYIEKYNLESKYRKVYIGDINKFDIFDYDFIILGDILEHLFVEDAVKLIHKIKSSKKDCLVAVPYSMPQGEHEGNKYETHRQEDLTPETMKERYPSLILIYGNDHYGYYTTVKHQKAYVLYATESYSDTVQGCVNSLNTFSKLPVYVYMMNSGIQIKGAHTIHWDCSITNPEQQQYIDRLNPDIYRILIQRPLIVQDVLQYSNVVAYVDSDSVATKYVDTIFDYYPKECSHPYFTDGIYDYLSINGLTDLELPACILFGVKTFQRKKYKQTGYFVAGQNTIQFLDSWWEMCNNPTILNNTNYFAPFNEETILNVLLWGNDISEGLPLIYINGTPDDIIKYGYTGTLIKEWLRIPAKEEELLFYHGEKNLEKMNQMISNKERKLRTMFIPSHLSTGGMPEFLRKRIECLKNLVDISVVEYQCYSMDYVVQRNAIKNMIGNFYTLYENKMSLFDIINEINPDIIHIDEMSERMDIDMVTKLYSPNRKYKIVETCHDVSFNPIDKKFIPDMFLFCTPYHLTTFKDVPGYAHLIEFPIDDSYTVTFRRNLARYNLGFNNEKRHVLSVGLWTEGKNQAEGLSIAKHYPEIMFHFVGNQAGNFKEYWEPLMQDIPDNVVIWGERDDVDVFYKACDVFMFNSLWECNPLVLHEAIGYGLPIIAHNLPQYCGMFDKYVQDIDTDLNTIVANYEIPTNNTSKEFGEKHMNIYTKLVNNQFNLNVHVPVTISQHFVNNPFLEITGNSDSDFLVKFFDENSVCHYENIIKSNHWVKLNRAYYTKWTAKVWENGNLIYENTLNYTGKRVYIAFDSESLGDTIAWMPYVLEFQKKHNCKVIVSTFKNFLFDYPELEFVEPGTKVDNIYGMYKIGWFYNTDMEPIFPDTIPLQQTICNILGLEYTEILPRINHISKSGTHVYQYVAIVTNSTMGCKFLPKETWQEVINHIVSKGYEVVNISKERNTFENCTQIEDVSIENTMHLIDHSQFVISLSSGLGWLAWAMNKQTVLIANFTEDWHEWSTNCIRITNKNVCHGCWNKKDIIFSKNKWSWCPNYEGTPRQWECHTKISSAMIIEKISKLL